MLADADIRYTQPDQDKYDPTTLDFYLVDFDIYIEVKQFYSGRIARQLAVVPPSTTVIVLMGPRSITDFGKLITALKTDVPATNKPYRVVEDTLC